MNKTADATATGGISKAMQDPVVQAAVKAAATAAFGPAGGAIASLALQVGGNYLGAKNEQDVRDMQSEALTGYLNSVDERRNNALQEIKGNYAEGDKQFNQEANTPLPQIGQMQNDIVQQATDAQQNNNKEYQAQLAEQGVRGGQAATLLGRQTGQLNRELNYDTNKLGYDEARNRQDTRLNYTAKKSLLPYESLNKDQWLRMPNASEQQLMMNAINTKFA